ncbi:MAG: hypothetical protein GEU81_00085 [Nitriliruptorales bacterium]|nr:hypothetical protein [Nitriliruptorales bacterium]
MARRDCRANPPIFTELGRALNVVADVRGAMLTTDGSHSGTPAAPPTERPSSDQPHGIMLVPEPAGVRGQCRCGWQSALLVGAAGDERNLAWARAEHAADAHLKSAGSSSAPGGSRR